MTQHTYKAQTRTDDRTAYCLCLALSWKGGLIMRYEFKTTTTMKLHNNKKWWIDRNIVAPMIIEAENINQALNIYSTHVRENSYIDISKNALKTKQNMYCECVTDGTTKQVGYVITGSTDFEDTDARSWKKQYIDLWVEICVVKNPFAI